MDIQQGPSAGHRELWSILCGSLVARGVWGKMDTCICMAESLRYSPETFSSFQSLSCVRLFVTPWTTANSRPPCPSPTPRVYSNTCPLCRWCHATISSSVVPFSSHLQFFPASGSFQMSQLFTSGGQSTRVSDSVSVLPMNTQDWSPLRWNGWSHCCPKDSRESSPTVQKHQFFGSHLSL